MSKRAAGWSVGLLGVAVIAAGWMRRRHIANSSRALRGKVVLITGGSRGLGFAIAEELALRGARLALTARDRAELARAKSRLVEAGRIAEQDVFIQAADVTQAADVAQTVAAATAYFGRIDIVVNNAGIILVGPVESQTLASFRQAMDTNFFGALHTTMAVLPQMLAREEGAIVNIASIGGKVAFSHLLPYVASKFALVGWSQGLRAELTRQGIQVTTVTPGVMRTGSHIQARYTGNTAKEYRWFAAAASFPGTAVDTKTAARKVVRAMLSGAAEIAIGLQAILAARLSNIAPEITADLLTVANGFLPRGPEDDVMSPGHFWEADQSVPGKNSSRVIAKVPGRYWSGCDPAV